MEGSSLWTNPTTFLLDHPQGYFVNHIILRLQRAYVAGQLKIDGLLPAGRPRAGGRPVEAVMNEEHDMMRAGGSVYPAGPKVTRREFDDAKKLAPVDSAGRYLCWEFFCYAGCKLSPAECLAANKRVHEMPKFKAVPPVLRLVFNRLGGVRTKKSKPL